VSGSTVDTKGKQVSAALAHLSPYALIVKSDKECGNGVIEADEPCDGAQLQGKTCPSEGFVGGTLSCKKDCTLDTSACYKCGDNLINPGEECDGTDLAGKSCASLGFAGGTLKCSSACKLTGCVTQGYVAIPAGTFSMGSPATEPCRNTNETQHEVVLTHDFEISATEIVQTDFNLVRGYSTPTCGAGCPAQNVNWYEAVAYCNALSEKLSLPLCYKCVGDKNEVICTEQTAYAGEKIYTCPGYRLPTDAEWEYAYRAGTTTAFYNGASAAATCKTCTDPTADAIAWFTCNSTNSTHPVKQKKANAWGLYDMAGNVWEWTHDPYLTDLGSTKVTDPVGPTTGSGRVVRGGHYGENAEGLRASSRYSGVTDARYLYMGFRCARTQ